MVRIWASVHRVCVRTLSRTSTAAWRWVRAITRSPWVLVGFTTSALLCPPIQAQEAIAITGGRIVDGVGGAPIENGVVLIRGDRITAVGTIESVSIPQGAQRIDATGKTLIPGLVDAHVHLMGGWDGVATDMLGYQRYLNALLYAGVTTVLDLGNVLPYVQQFRQEIEEGRISGPRILFVGPLLDGPEPAWPPLSYSVSASGQVSYFVDHLKEAGVDALKAYGGLSREALMALIDEAETASLDVIAHIGSDPGFAETIRFGIAASAHLPVGAVSDSDLQYMAEEGFACITTLAMYEYRNRRRLKDLTFLTHPLIRNTSPRWVLEEIESRFSGVSVTLPGGILESAQENGKRMEDAGVLVVAGTDAPYPGVFQGEAIHRELELLVEAGFSPLQAITAATRNAAILMDAEGEWGTLEPGAIADVVAVNGNSATEVGNTREIAFVIQGGRLLDRGSLEFDSESNPSFRPVGTTRAGVVGPGLLFLVVLFFPLNGGIVGAFLRRWKAVIGFALGYLVMPVGALVLLGIGAGSVETAVLPMAGVAVFTATFTVAGTVGSVCASLAVGKAERGLVWRRGVASFAGAGALGGLLWAVLPGPLALLGYFGPQAIPIVLLRRAFRSGHRGSG